MIQEVKSLDCQLWPISFSYQPESDKFIIYIGDCVAIDDMKKNNQLDSWLTKQKEMLYSRIKAFTPSELVAYSYLTGKPWITNPEVKIVEIKSIKSLI